MDTMKLPKIDWSNPLTRGLALVYLPGYSEKNIVNYNYPLELTQGGLKTKTSPMGLVFDNPNILNEGLGTGAGSPITKANDTHTIAAVCCANGTAETGFGTIFGINRDGGIGVPSITAHSLFIYNVLGYYGFDLVFENFGSTYAPAASVTTPTGEWVTLVGVSDSIADTRYFYTSYEGVRSESVSFGGTATTLDSISSGVFWEDPAAVQEFDGKSALHCAWKDRALSAAEAQAFIDNPWQIFKSQRIIIPVAKYDPTLAPEEVAPAIVEGLITFSTTLDKTNSIKLTALASASFLANLTMLQNIASIDANISFGIDLTQVESNTAARPVSFAATIDLDQLQTNQADMVRSALFNMSASQNQTNVKITDNIISFSTDLSYEVLNQLITSADATFSTDLSYEVLNQLIGSADATFSTDLSQSLLNQLVADKNVTFSSDLSYTILNQLITSESFSFNTDLGYNILNGLLLSESVNFSTDLGYNILNQLVSDKSINFNTDLGYSILNKLIAEKLVNFNVDADYSIINRLIAGKSITFTTDLDFQFNADGAGIVNAAISFIANMSQAQSNVITIEKAVSLIMDLAATYDKQLDTLQVLNLLVQVSQAQDASRGVSGAISFDTQLDQTQTNLASRVAALALTASMDQTLDTQLNYGLLMTFATALTMQPASDGEVFGTINFGITVNQQEVSIKDTAEAVAFSLQTDMQTDIHLAATGEITLGVEMEQVHALQTAATAGITFGHLLGLSQINGAELGADISFGTVQNFQVNGFTLQFEILTPDSRTLRIFVEDRTTIVDEGNRVFRINRN
jgi:hypothetical protein